MRAMRHAVGITLFRAPSRGFAGWLTLTLAVGCSAPESGPRTASDAAVTEDNAAVTDAPRPDAAGTGTETYGNCFGSPRGINDDACAGTLACIPGYSRTGEVQWCAPPCNLAMMGADCPPAPAGSTLRPTCIQADPGANYCALGCVASRNECPAGMVCFLGACAWPR